MPDQKRQDATTHDLVIEVLTKLDAYERRTEALEHVVFDNGGPGLKGQVAALVTAAASRKWFERAIIGAFLIPTAGGACAGIIYLIRHAG